MSAEAKLEAFVAHMVTLPLSGLYLVGSHALDDVRPGSDIDFVAVLPRWPEASELEALVAVHAELRQAWPAPHLDGFYVLPTDLSRPAEDVVPALRYVSGERVDSRPGAVTPVEWIQ